MEKRDWPWVAFKVGAVTLVASQVVLFACLITQAVVMRGVPVGPAWGNWWKVLLK